MAIVEYKLSHRTKQCDIEFYPYETARLWVESVHAKRFKYQDLMRGICPACKADVFAWIGVDYLDHASQYFCINPKRHEDWLARYQTDLVREHDRRAHSTVTGCRYDARSGRYLFCENIPVH